MTYDEKLAASREYQREWRKSHPDYQREWRKNHPGYHKEWHRNHPDKGREYGATYRAKHPERSQVEYRRRKLAALRAAATVREGVRE